MWDWRIALKRAPHTLKTVIQHCFRIEHWENLNFLTLSTILWKLSWGTTPWIWLFHLHFLRKHHNSIQISKTLHILLQCGNRQEGKMDNLIRSNNLLFYHKLWTVAMIGISCIKDNLKKPIPIFADFWELSQFASWLDVLQENFPIIF